MTPRLGVAGVAKRRHGEAVGGACRVTAGRRCGLCGEDGVRGSSGGALAGLPRGGIVSPPTGSGLP